MTIATGGFQAVYLPIQLRSRSDDGRYHLDRKRGMASIREVVLGMVKLLELVSSRKDSRAACMQDASYHHHRAARYGLVEPMKIKSEGCSSDGWTVIASHA